MLGDIVINLIILTNLRRTLLKVALQKSSQALCKGKILIVDHLTLS